MKPIPKSLLIHSAVLYEVKENAWQETEKKELARLSGIRIEPSSKMVVTSNNRSVTLSATLLIFNGRFCGYLDCCSGG